MNDMTEKIFSPETYSMIGQWAIGFCKDLVVAVIVFIIGNWLIKWMKKLIKKMMQRSKIEPSLTTFLTSIVNVVLWLTLIRQTSRLSKPPAGPFRSSDGPEQTP